MVYSCVKFDNKRSKTRLIFGIQTVKVITSNILFVFSRRIGEGGFNLENSGSTTSFYYWRTRL